MNYETFSKLWDLYIGDKCMFLCEENTNQALIEYGQGNKTKIEEIRAILNRK